MPLEQPLKDGDIVLLSSGILAMIFENVYLSTDRDKVMLLALPKDHVPQRTWAVYKSTGVPTTTYFNPAAIHDETLTPKPHVIKVLDNLEWIGDGEYHRTDEGRDNDRARYPVLVRGGVVQYMLQEECRLNSFCWGTISKDGLTKYFLKVGAKVAKPVHKLYKYTTGGDR